ncbi:MAG: glutamine--tRNA ligase/YqeY domain fusion protein, partial [Acidimicrobiia bacterium]
VDLGKLEYCVRDDLNRVAPRVLGVLRPLRVTITSWPGGEGGGGGGVEELSAPYFPPDIGTPGERTVPFSGEILIDRDDFALDPPPGYQRLAPGRTVRLRHAYCITCDEVVEGDDGEVIGLRCRHIPGTVGANPSDVKVWGVLHWVAAGHGVPAEVRLYERLFRHPRPDDTEDLGAALNPGSLEVVETAMLEPSLAGAEPGSRWQLERVGYFSFDPVDSRPGALVLNRIVTLRDSWRAPPDQPRPVAHSAKAKTRPPKRSRTEYRAEARSRDPVLAERLASWPGAHGISAADAELLTGDRPTGDLFVAAVAAGAPPVAAARWIVNELPRELGDRPLSEIPTTGAALGELVAAVESGEVSGPAGKEVFAELMRHGGDPRRIIAVRGLAQTSDEGEIAAVVDEVLAAHAERVAEYRAGKTALLGFFVGQAVKASGGKANPKVVGRLLADRLR